MASALTTARARCVAFTGGGTAGHVFPGLAVAAELARRWDGRVVWIGSRSGPERDLVEAAGIPFRAIPAGKLRRYLSISNVTDVFRILGGLAASLRVLAAERPALLFSKGGFVSVPPVIAARLLGIPAFTHESDVDPGLATRINARFCERVMVSHAGTVGHFPPAVRGRVMVTGNPLRASIYAADPAEGRRVGGLRPGERLVLVLGGSSGSAFLNGLVAPVAGELCAGGIRLVHQTGDGKQGAAGVPRLPGDAVHRGRAAAPAGGGRPGGLPGRRQHARRARRAGQAVPPRAALDGGEPGRPAAECRGLPRGGGGRRDDARRRRAPRRSSSGCGGSSPTPGASPRWPPRPALSRRRTPRGRSRTSWSPASARREPADVREHHRAAGRGRRPVGGARGRRVPAGLALRGPPVRGEAVDRTRGGAGPHVHGRRSVGLRVHRVPPAAGARASAHRHARVAVLRRGDRGQRRRPAGEPRHRHALPVPAGRAEAPAPVRARGLGRRRCPHARRAGEDPAGGGRDRPARPGPRASAADELAAVTERADALCRELAQLARSTSSPSARCACSPPGRT